jgi:D-alanine-D-alanine ligase
METKKEFTSLGNRGLRQILEEMNIPYTGAQKAGAEATKNKIDSKIAFLESNLSTPKYKILKLNNELEVEAKRIANELKFPLIVKPRDEGSSIGIDIARDARQLIEIVSRLREIVSRLRERFSHIFVEEYLTGKEVTVPILEINGAAKALAVIEIDHNSDFYSSDIKLRDFRMANQGKESSLFHVPARLNDDMYKTVQKAAVAAHCAVGCRKDS